jgi:hypothetical protein
VEIPDILPAAGPQLIWVTLFTVVDLHGGHHDSRYERLFAHETSIYSVNGYWREEMNRAEREARIKGFGQPGYFRNT